jgi:hypothetical protein
MQPMMTRKKERQRSLYSANLERVKDSSGGYKSLKNINNNSAFFLKLSNQKGFGSTSIKPYESG